MPTPVSTARQCLTDEAARALDDAVAVARRRSHAQTTSLHAVSALIAPASSSLREACARARSSAYSPRLQFRALELSVGVSLDRVPTAKAVEEPPVSNSLMAAIKRSQANQRRHPDTFHLYQQMQHQGQSSLSCVKVELKHFILSILDDPIVSRVFGEAGFRSCDIKLAILNPPSLSRFPRRPPLFLCNLTDPDSTPRNFNFPFAGFPASDTGDENCRRIGEILGKKKGNNPLLVGVCANDALKAFTERLQRKKTGLLPAEIDGMTVISAEKEISEFISKGGSKELIDLKIREVSDALENCSAPGIVVNIGELKDLLGDNDSMDSVKHVVSEITRLLETHSEKLRLMGAAGSYETYMKILAQFPSIQKHWDLHLLPISSSTPSSGGLYTKPSLMGSFVPFGGFFSSPSELKSISSSANLSTRCDLCNEKYEQEVSVLLKGGSTSSVADQCSSNKSSWLQMAECDASKRQDLAEAEDSGTLLNLKLKGVQRKWNDICQRLHPTPFRADFPQPRPETQQVDRNLCSSKDSSSIESRSPDPVCSTPMDHLQKISLGFCESRRTEFQQACGVEHSLRSPVTTDLGLGTLYVGPRKEPGNLNLVDHSNRLKCVSGSVTSGDGRNVSCLTSSDLKSRRTVDPKDFKSLWRALTEKVGRQGEAICTVSRALAISKNGEGKNKRGDIWLSFLGSDKMGKKKTAEALAEVVFGSRDSLISVDLSLEDGISCSNSIFRQKDLDSFDAKFRGKTAVDIVAEELSRRPQSVVLLENVDKADFLFQNSLSQALNNGKFRDSRGREISINNAIFVSTFASKDSISEKRRVQYSEERILGAKRWQMRLLISCNDDGDATRAAHGLNVSVNHRMQNSKPTTTKKRKFIDINDSSEIPKQVQKSSRWSLDLNLPLEEEYDDGNSQSDSDGDSITENSELWLEDFFSQVDEKVIFQPFDFDALANQILKEIDQSLKKTLGSEFFLEVDEEVIVQILAAAWLCDNNKAVSDWVEQVLGRSLAEARLKDRLAAQSTVKLVACDGLCAEEEAPGISLPARIVFD